MTTQTIRSENDKYNLYDLINDMTPPLTVKITEGIDRSLEQNRLQQKWHTEAAQQLKDESAEDKRAYCKLHFGVPIRREHDEDFKAAYDRVIRPLTYEQKLEAMKIPLDFPVTRDMSMKEKKEYLKQVQDFYRGLNVKLTEPQEQSK